MNNTDEVYEELRKVPWFQDLEPGDIRKFAEISTLRHFKAGEVFFHEGDKQDYFYVVLSGRVALDISIPHRGKVRFYTCEEGDSFGWSSVTPEVRTRTAGAVGVMAGSVISTDTTKLQTLCDQDHDIGYLFMHHMANVIASRLLVTRLQLLDMFAEPMETKSDE
jgi:CRP/FNR family cyclic AMP-dependent transcriptional regulator